jgi:multimeric flavodoxin WrbA
MPMKIMAINGSPRKSQSRTGQILEEILAGARAEGALTEYIDITALNVGCCIGCGRCHHLGQCALKDDFNELFDKMLASDGLVLGSPVYIYQVTAQLKALIDRLSHAIHCQRLCGKYGAVAATAGGSGQDETADFMESLLNRVGAQSVGRIACILEDGLIPAEADALQKARDLGSSLVQAFREKRQYPDQIARMEGIRGYFRSIVTKRKDLWDWEYRDWQEKGWL